MLNKRFANLGFGEGWLLGPDGQSFRVPSGGTHIGYVDSHMGSFNQYGKTIGVVFDKLVKVRLFRRRLSLVLLSTSVVSFGTVKQFVEKMASSVGGSLLVDIVLERSRNNSIEVESERLKDFDSWIELFKTARENGGRIAVVRSASNFGQPWLLGDDGQVFRLPASADHLSYLADHADEFHGYGEQPLTRMATARLVRSTLFVSVPYPWTKWLRTIQTFATRVPFDALEVSFSSSPDRILRVTKQQLEGADSWSELNKTVRRGRTAGADFGDAWLVEPSGQTHRLGDWSVHEEYIAEHEDHFEQYGDEPLYRLLAARMVNGSLTVVVPTLTAAWLRLLKGFLTTLPKPPGPLDIRVTVYRWDTDSEVASVPRQQLLSADSWAELIKGARQPRTAAGTMGQPWLLGDDGQSFKMPVDATHWDYVRRRPQEFARYGASPMDRLATIRVFGRHATVELPSINQGWLQRLQDFGTAVPFDNILVAVADRPEWSVRATRRNFFEADRWSDLIRASRVASDDGAFDNAWIVEPTGRIWKVPSNTSHDDFLSEHESEFKQYGANYWDQEKKMMTLRWFRKDAGVTIPSATSVWLRLLKTTIAGVLSDDARVSVGTWNDGKHVVSTTCGEIRDADSWAELIKGARQARTATTMGRAWIVEGDGGVVELPRGMDHLAYMREHPDRFGRYGAYPLSYVATVRLVGRILMVTMVQPLNRALTGVQGIAESTHPDLINVVLKSNERQLYYVRPQQLAAADRWVDAFKASRENRVASAASRPVLTLDFDGVVHAYTSPWTEPHIVSDPPVDRAFSAIHRYLEAFDVYILSARFGRHSGDARTNQLAVRDWMIRWGFPGDLVTVDGQHRDGTVKLTSTKPPNHVSLDDTGITFTGRWPSVERLQRFRPWNHRRRTVAALVALRP